MDRKYYTFNKEPFFQIAKEYIIESSIVLDVGPGNGTFSDFCGRKDFYLFEGNKESARKLERRHDKVFCGELPTLPFEDNFFDLIHCSHVIEHLQPQEFYDTLKEMDRCLKPEGYLVISAPLMWEGFYNDISHVKPYNPKVFYNYLIKNKSSSRTRPKISEDYKQVNLIYRYREISVTNNFFQENNNLWVKLLFSIVYKLERYGLRNREKTGYTIVLQKG